MPRNWASWRVAWLERRRESARSVATLLSGAGSASYPFFDLLQVCRVARQLPRRASQAAGSPEVLLVVLLSQLAPAKLAEL
jgi:hypothetical protein